MKFSFIIVNYKSRQYLKDCTDSIINFAKGKVDYEIIIVNNDCDKLPNNTGIVIKEVGKNVGYAKANNMGASLAKGDVFCFLNPDTKFLENGDIFHICNLFENESVGIIGPRILTEDGNIQPWLAGYEISLFDTIKNNFGFIKSKSLWEKSSICQVSWVSGASLFIRKNVFEKLSGFDENFFLYFEDVDLCKRAGFLGKKILLTPEIKITHYCGKSSDNSAKQKKYYYISQDYYFKKHFGKISTFFLKLLRFIFA